MGRSSDAVKTVRLLTLFLLLALLVPLVLPPLNIGESFSFGLKSSILLNVCPMGPPLPLGAPDDDDVAVVAFPPRPWLVPVAVSFLGKRYGLKPINC